MSEATFTFRVDEDLKDQFASAAEAQEQTGEEVLRNFMQEFVRQQSAEGHDAWFRREVQMGIDAANAGAVVSSEEVEAQAQAWRTEMLSNLNRAKT